MITRVKGHVREVAEEAVLLEIPPWHLEVAVTELTRRALQSRVGDLVSLHTMFYIDGNASVGSRMTPRLVGFLTPLEREFFEVFCSVDGVGVRKALRAIGLPIRDIARYIQDQRVDSLATLPGIGEALAERVVAKLRRKVGKFALMVPGHDAPARNPGEPERDNGRPPDVEADVLADTYAALLSVGHSDAQARQMIDRVLVSRKKFKSVADMIEAIYQTHRED